MTFRDVGNPTTSNDSTQGFVQDGLWLNTTEDTLHRCLNPAPPAEWVRVDGDPPRVVTASGAMVKRDTVLMVDSSAGVVVVSLVAAALFKDKILRMLHTVPVNDLFLVPFEGELISGEPFAGLAGDRMRSLTLFCDGSAWFVA